MPARLADGLGRVVRYLRISVTDRCNLRCHYCRDGYDSFIPHDDILRYEEIDRLIDLLVANGVGKLRFTGGEPLVRKGFMGFLAKVRQRHPGVALRLTSNGTLLGPVVDELKRLDVSVNLSLDSFKPEVFAHITGQEEFGTVSHTLERMLAVGLPFKINAVALKGINDGELPEFLRLAMREPVDVRFIEFMPMGHGTRWSNDTFWPAREILAQARELYGLERDAEAAGEAGPARMWRLRDSTGALSRGRFGVISSVSDGACHVCNRLRLTAEGNLRTCLFDDRDYPLRPILRHPRLNDATLLRTISAALVRKPVGTSLLAKARGAVAQRRMVAIGG